MNSIMMEFTLIGKDAGIYTYSDMILEGGRHTKLLCYFNGRLYWGSKLKRYCEKKIDCLSCNHEGYVINYKVKIDNGVTLFEIHNMSHHLDFHNAESIEEAKRWLEGRLEANIEFDNFVQFMQEEYTNRYYVIIDRLQRLSNAKKISLNSSMIEGYGRIDKEFSKGEIYFNNKRFELAIDILDFDPDTMEGVKILNAPSSAKITKIKKSLPRQEFLYAVKGEVSKEDLINCRRI